LILLVFHYCWYIDHGYPGSKSQGYVASKLCFGEVELPENVAPWYNTDVGTEADAPMLFILSSTFTCDRSSP
ncbi:MAG: hypothetical protein ABF329_01580, partial [Lentimonas sp.]